MWPDNETDRDFLNFTGVLRIPLLRSSSKPRAALFRLGSPALGASVNHP